jgi:hypothetical protein
MENCSSRQISVYFDYILERTLYTRNSCYDFPRDISNLDLDNWKNYLFYGKKLVLILLGDRYIDKIDDLDVNGFSLIKAPAALAVQLNFSEYNSVKILVIITPEIRE